MRRLGIQAMETAALVKSDGTRVDMGLDARATEGLREPLRVLKQSAAVPRALHILTDGNASKDGDVAADVHANHGDCSALVPEHEWMVVRPELVGVVRIIRVATAQLEQDAPSNVMIGAPLEVRRRRSQIVRHQTRNLP